MVNYLNAFKTRKVLIERRRPPHNLFPHYDQSPMIFDLGFDVWKIEG